MTLPNDSTDRIIVLFISRKRYFRAATDIYEMFDKV